MRLPARDPGRSPSPECYHMDLYCCAAGCQTSTYGPPAQFTGRDRADAHRQAKAAGWKIVKGYAYCPDCLRAMRDTNR